MFDGLVRRAILAHAERVVCPDIDHVQAHQRGKAHGGFHVVRKNKEGAAGRDHAPVQRHAVRHAGHRQLRDARLEELAAEIALRESLGLLEETVGLVRIGEVGRSHDHIFDLLGKDAQHRGRRRTRRNACLYLDGLVVDLGQVPREEHVELAGQLAVLAAPRLLDPGLAGSPCTERFAALCKGLAALFEHGERVFRIAPEVFHRGGEIGACRRKRLPVGRYLVLEASAVGSAGPLAHDRMADDERRAFRFGIGRHERLADFIDIVPVDRQYVPAPGFVFHGHVLGVHLIDLGRELDVVRIVVHDEVAQPQMPCDASHALRDLLFDGAVGDVGIGLVRHPLAEAGRHEPLRDGGAQRHGMSLPERARGILHTAHHVHLGVAGRHAAPLAQRLQVFGRIVSRQRQHRVEHRRHMPRIEEETVTVGVSHVIGVVTQELGIEHRHEVGTAHGAAGMPRFGFLDHGGRKDTDIVGHTGQFGIGR